MKMKLRKQCSLLLNAWWWSIQGGGTVSVPSVPYNKRPEGSNGLSIPSGFCWCSSSRWFTSSYRRALELFNSSDCFLPLWPINEVLRTAYTILHLNTDKSKPPVAPPKEESDVLSGGRQLWSQKRALLRPTCERYEGFQPFLTLLYLKIVTYTVTQTSKYIILYITFKICVVRHSLQFVNTLFPSSALSSRRHSSASVLILPLRGFFFMPRSA